MKNKINLIIEPDVDFYVLLDEFTLAATTAGWTEDEIANAINDDILGGLSDPDAVVEYLRGLGATAEATPASLR